nr:hypothetical protein [Pseudomonas sp.]
MSPVISYGLAASFAILVACFFVTVVCGIALFFVKWRTVNNAFKHPLLEVKPFKRHPFSLQSAITLDYFFRLMFPKSVGPGIVGNANRLLKHVKPRELPFGARWPVAGFWGGCFLGIIAMMSLWGFLAFTL